MKYWLKINELVSEECRKHFPRQLREWQKLGEASWGAEIIANKLRKEWKEAEEEAAKLEIPTGDYRDFEIRMVKWKQAQKVATAKYKKLREAETNESRIDEKMEKAREKCIWLVLQRLTEEAQR